MRKIVENMLPAELLLKQGTYVQTCAQIELAIWDIIKIAVGFDPSDQAAFEKYLRLKLRTRPMLEELRRAAQDVPARYGLEMRYLAARVKTGLETRNMAAHGAFFLDKDTGKLRVEHYFTRGRGKAAEWFHTTGSFTMRDVDAAIADADEILHDAVRLRSALDAHLAQPAQNPRIRACRTAIYRFM